MADRREFTAKTRKQARARSGMRCEAIGHWYGLPTGQRCNADLKLAGVEYDHFLLDANSKDNSLANCRAVCPKCHRWKTSHIDVPTAAKTKRQELMGAKSRPKARIPSRPKSSRKQTRIDKAAMKPLAPRNLYTHEEIRS
jgi:hypothetical protein